MSTIKSSNDHLTLSSDGSNKDIKFQANGVEKASISSAGAFTSTTIDATKLTGTIPNFTSTGIDDNADATAITIDSSENVGIGLTSPDTTLHIKGSAQIAKLETTSATGQNYIRFADGSGDKAYFGYSSGANDHLTLFNQENADIAFGTNDTERFRITSDGRGLSQFTAKVWVNFDGTGTVGINDSHNVSSITDISTGQYRVNFANNMGNANYSVVSGDNAWGNGWNDAIAVGSISTKRRNESGGYVDAAYVSVLVFGD